MMMEAAANLNTKVWHSLLAGHHGGRGVNINACITGKQSKRPNRGQKADTAGEAQEEPGPWDTGAALVDAGCFLGDLMAKANKVRDGGARAER